MCVVCVEAHRYTLLGLLNVIRMTDADRNTLALGTDLTTVRAVCCAVIIIVIIIIIVIGCSSRPMHSLA